jgi:quercetin dioxygenase-like cupin family protein
MRKSSPSSEIFVPKNILKETMDLSDILDKLDYAASQTPVRLKNIRESNDPTVLQVVSGDTVCLEPICNIEGTIAVCLAYFNPNSIVVNHHHGQSYEIVYCKIGHCYIEMQKDDDIIRYDMKQGQCLTIPPNTAHTVQATELSILVCITVPADNDYPLIDDGKAG